MELPYVLECGVSAVPDEVRGQVVKASIVLTKGTEPTEQLKKEIQNSHTPQVQEALQTPSRLQPMAMKKQA
jgi:acyl-coenzyme A synthetase/AMP-(fatty) acid ligase